MYHVPGAIALNAGLYYLKYSTHNIAQQARALQRRWLIFTLAPAALPDKIRTELRQFLGGYTLEQLQNLDRLPPSKLITTLYRPFITASLPNLNQELLRCILERLDSIQLAGIASQAWEEREATIRMIIMQLMPLGYPNELKQLIINAVSTNAAASAA